MENHWERSLTNWMSVSLTIVHTYFLKYESFTTVLTTYFFKPLWQPFPKLTFIGTSGGSVFHASMCFPHHLGTYLVRKFAKRLINETLRIGFFITNFISSVFLLVIAIAIHHFIYDRDPKKVPEYVKNSIQFSSSESDDDKNEDGDSDNSSDAAGL